MADRIISYVFKGTFAGLTGPMTVAAKSTKEFAGQLNALDAKGAKMRANLSQLGGTAGKIGLVAAAGLGAAVTAAANFDKAMSAVQAATHESAKNMDLLRDAAIEAGARTVYSAGESASAIEELAKAGVSTADILHGGLNGALDLAAAGALGVGDAAEIAATAMTQFKLAGDQVPHVADLLAAGAGKAQGDVTDLGMALKQSGLVASQMGISIEETTGTLAAFASAGLLGSDAGTSFRTMLLRLANPTTESAKLMKALGIQAYDAQGQFVGMASIAGQLQEAFKGSTQATRDAAMATLFGSDAIRAANVLFSQGAEGVKQWTANVDDAGYAAETASTRLDNLSGDLEQLKGSLETALIGTGEGSQGPLRDLTQNATNAVNAFNGLPNSIKSTTTAALGLTAVFGGGLWFTSKVIGGITAMRGSLEALTGQAVSTRAALTAIGTAGIATSVGLGTFIDSLDMLDSWKRSRTAADETSKSFEDLADALRFSNAGKYADDLHINLDRLTKDLAENGKNGEYASRVLGQLKDSSHGFGAAVNAIFGNIAPGFDSGSEKAYSARADILAIIEHSTVAAGDAASAAADPMARYGQAIKLAANANYTASLDINAAVDSMQKQHKAALGAFDAVTQYGGALKAAQDAAKKGKRGIDENTEAGRENRDALSGLAAAWNNQGEIVKNSESKYRQARRDFIDTATAMGVPEEAAKKLAKRLLDIPESLVTKYELQAAEANSVIGRIKRELASIPKSVRTQIHTDYYVNQVNAINKRQERAGGGHILGPGTATSDSIPARLSNGEYVIKAAAVNRYGVAMFDHLNAMRFASGGPVGGRDSFGPITDLRAPYRTAAAFGIDIDRDGKLKRQLRLFGVALDKAKDALQEETQARDSLIGSVKMSLTRDLWGGTESGFSSRFASGSIAGANAQLAQQISDAREFEAITAQLRGRGLSGAALQEILAGGIDRARMAVASSNSDLQTFGSRYNSAQALTSRAATATADMLGLTSAQQDTANQVRVLNQTVKSLQRQLDAAEKRASRDRRAAPAKTGAATSRAINRSAGHANSKRG